MYEVQLALLSAQKFQQIFTPFIPNKMRRQKRLNKIKEGELKDIFELLRNGESEALGLLYQSHYNRLYGIAMSVLNDANDAEDVVHNVIIKLYNLDKEKFPKDHELSWLYSVVKNEALDFKRKQKREAPLDCPVALNDKNIEQFADMDSYYSMIEGLNDMQRQIVTLKVLGGYTHREIAAMLNKPCGTVQWIYNTAVKKLRVLLSALATMILIVSGGITAHVLVFARYIEEMNEYNSSLIQSAGNAPPPYYPVSLFGILLGVLIFLLAAAVTAFAIIYIKSPNIPTKCNDK